MEKCSGEGQGTCKRCKDMGIWNRNCLKGQLKATACEIFQGKEIRNVLAERIMEELNKCL